MTSDIHLAFAHPVERSEATALTEEPRDRISLRDHTVEVEIGAFQAERGAKQRVRFNIVVELPPQTGAVDDDVDKVLSYDTITDAIATELASERLNLLETLAERIAHRLLAEPQPMRVFVRIEKLDRGPGALGVEIVRSRQPDIKPVSASGHAIEPLVLFLAQDALDHAQLPDLIDRIEAKGTPSILCVGVPDGFGPTTDTPLVQRRIDLLAIEQNAWMLAGRDHRCVVTSSRTELDWAMKHGQICVWAPSKIVLDAVDGPKVGPKHAVALAKWFAGLVHASDFIVVGGQGADAQSVEQVLSAL